MNVPTPAELRATKPANPADISFAADCFVETGRGPEYWLVTRAGWAGGCTRTQDPAVVARAIAGGREVRGPFTSPIMTRVKWR